MPVEDFAGEHDDVLAEAALIYRNKSKTRGQMWMDTTIKRELDMIEEKLTRARSSLGFGLEDGEFMFEFEDSLLDIINFADFAIKKARRGMRA